MGPSVHLENAICINNKETRKDADIKYENKKHIIWYVETIWNLLVHVGSEPDSGVERKFLLALYNSWLNNRIDFELDYKGNSYKIVKKIFEFSSKSKTSNSNSFHLFLMTVCQNLFFYYLKKHNIKNSKYSKCFENDISNLEDINYEIEFRTETNYGSSDEASSDEAVAKDSLCTACKKRTISEDVKPKKDPTYEPRDYDFEYRPKLGTSDDLRKLSTIFFYDIDINNDKEADEFDDFVDDYLYKHCSKIIKTEDIYIGRPVRNAENKIQYLPKLSELIEKYGADAQITIVTRTHCHH